MRPNDSTERAEPGGHGLGFERLMFFSDAVFAIAITLLVLDLKAPVGANGDFNLAPTIPNIMGFGLSFYVVGRYWMAHHRLFEAVTGYDGPLMVTNLAFLAAIAFLPFPTSIVAQANARTGPVVFYTLSVAAVGLMMLLLTAVARRPRFLRPGETGGGTARFALGAMVTPVVFLASAALATIRPRDALVLLLALAPAGVICDRLGKALQRRIDGAAAADAAAES